MYSNIRDKRQTRENFQMSFSKLEEDFENWLTETEVKMITLQPYTIAEEELDDQVKNLKILNREIKEREPLLKELLQSRDQIEEDGLSRRGIVEELNQRYQKVIKVTPTHYSTTH